MTIIIASCGSDVSIDTTISDAEQAYADGDYSRSQELCNSLTSGEFDKLSEEQLGRLAILYMKLSESSNSYDNIAEAAVCIQQAWKLSTDSMQGFASSLSPEDLPHFVMITRIGGSLDAPLDLSEEHFDEDSIHLPAEHLQQ